MAEAKLLFQAKKIPEALQTAEKAIKKSEEEFGPENPAVLPALKTISIIYQTMYDFPNAEASYKRALAITKQTAGPEDIEVAKLMNNLAGIYFFQKQYENASNIYKESLAIATKNLSPDDPQLAILHTNIASCEALLSGQPLEQKTDQTTPVQAIQDIVPDEIKKTAIEQLARQNIVISDLQPAMPIRIGDQGIVLPYHGMKKTDEDSGDGLDVVLLFSALKNQEKENAYIFKQCRMVSAQSYQNEIKTGSPETLKKTIIGLFPDLYF